MKDNPQLIEEFRHLLEELIQHIDDDCRATDDPSDDQPGMQVTFASDDLEEWIYQTGDNSFHGGCYSYRHWGVVYLYRDSDCRALASDAYEQIADAVADEDQADNSCRSCGRELGSNRHCDECRDYGRAA